MESGGLPEGMKAVTGYAVNGFAAIPPKGGGGELSREQIRKATQ